MKVKLSIILLCVLFISQFLLAQEDSIKLYTWTPLAVVGINLSQVALSNWTQGGENALAVSLTPIERCTGAAGSGLGVEGRSRPRNPQAPGSPCTPRARGSTGDPAFRGGPRS